jgi:hypothetical protein
MDSSHQNWDENFITIKSKESFRVGECKQVDLPDPERRVSVSWTLMLKATSIPVADFSIHDVTRMDSLDG